MRAQAEKGRGRLGCMQPQSSCGWCDTVPALCREHVGEGACWILCPGDCGILQGCGFGLLRLWEKLGLVEV